MKWIMTMVVLLGLTGAGSDAAVRVTLKGSPASMQRQHHVARQADYEFVAGTEELGKLVASGSLVELRGNRDYHVKRSVSYPFARPEMRLFIERLAEQYHEGTGERLVVTSLMRPQSRQPRNAHELSVHPTGIAVDLRVSRRRASRQWIESVLLKLERRGLLDVTRERWPPHYHVALFPKAYRTYVEGMIGADAVAAALAGERFYKMAPAPRAGAGKVVPPTQIVAAANSQVLGEGDESWSIWLLIIAVATIAIVTEGVRRRGSRRGSFDACPKRPHWGR